MLTLYQKTDSGDYEKVDHPSFGQSVAIYGVNLTHAEAKLAAADLDLSPNIIRDVFDTNELPRIEVSGGGHYIFLRVPEVKKTTINTKPVLLIVKDNFFACLAPHQSSVVELHRPVEPNGDNHARSLLAITVLSVSKQYENLIDSIGAHITKIEKKMRSHDATNKDFFDFVTVESNLNRSKMSLTGMQAVVERLLDMSGGGLKSSDHEVLDDIRLFAKQLLVEVDSHMQSIRSIRDAYTTVANNTLNLRMKALTFLTLLVALPNVFYGMYGMNIKLPFMTEPWAYNVIVGFTLLLIIIIIVIARRRRLF